MRLTSVFLILALIGMVLPTYLVFDEMSKINWDWSLAMTDLRAFFESLFGRLVVVWLLISGTALAVFVGFEAHVRRDYYLLWAIPVLLAFGIGAALPFYLYLRFPKGD